jgi:hypothetical protein
MHQEKDHERYADYHCFCGRFFHGFVLGETLPVFLFVPKGFNTPPFPRIFAA